MGPHPAVATVRIAVRRSLTAVEPLSTLIVACSGGADSMALLAATVFESRTGRLRVIGATVDHGLQPGSAERAAQVAAQMRALGVDEAEILTVEVGATGGPEAAARTARYATLDDLGERRQAAAILLGHTRDDQAETVLLGLARGSGARSLSGMAPVRGRYRRPLLEVSRVETVAACRAEDIDFWADPHNDDPSYARVRVRHEVLPVLEKELGPGVAEALARTARLLRDDADALDALAQEALTDVLDTTEEQLRVEPLAQLPAAVRRRVLRLAAVAAGCPPTELFASHLEEVDALITRWRGQQWIDLPGPVRVARTGGILRFTLRAVAG